MRILVTGGSGFIGSNLTQHLRSQGHEILNMDIQAPRRKPETVVWMRSSVLDAAAVNSVLSSFRPHLVIHMAARTDLYGQSLQDYRVNYVGVEVLLKALSAAPRTAVIWVSTRLVNPVGAEPTSDEDCSPPNLYGASKELGERLVRERWISGRPWMIVRPTSIWGPYFGEPYRVFFDNVLSNRYLHPRGRRIMKSFGFVGNIVHQFGSLGQYLIGESVKGLETVYLCDYDPIDVKQWADIIARWGNASPVRSVPLPLLRAAARLGDVMDSSSRPAPLTTRRLQNLVTDMVYATSRLKALTGALPYTLEQGTCLTLEWLRSVGDVRD